MPMPQQLQLTAGGARPPCGQWDSQRGAEWKPVAIHPLALKRARGQEQAGFLGLWQVAFLKPAKRFCVIRGTESNGLKYVSGPPGEWRS